MDITTNGHNEDLQNFKVTLKVESWPEVCNILKNKSGYWVWLTCYYIILKKSNCSILWGLIQLFKIFFLDD